MRWLKLLLKIMAGAMLLVVLLWLGVAAYVNLNKKAVLGTITNQLNDNINGQLDIESMEPTLIRGFPGISVRLKNVLLRDSLWSVHHKDLLRAKDVYVSVNAWSVVTGSPRIRDISINDGEVYLFTDSNGYSNTTLFQKKQDTTAKKKGQPRINHLYFNNVKLVFENNTKAKLFRIDMRKLETVLNYTAEGWDADIDLDMKVNDLAFNTAKGSYLKSKHLEGGLLISYNTATNTLAIPQQKIKIDKDKIEIGGKFVFAEKPGTFILKINASNIHFKDATSLLSQSISAKLNKIDFTEPVDIQATIDGSMKYRDTPLVVVNWQIEDNTFITPGGNIKCSFTGTFMNEHVKGLGHNDPNSRIALSNFKGSWEDIPFEADTVTITNLKSPVLEGHYTSVFPVTKLNPIIGGNTFHLDKGDANVDLFYKGGVQNNDTTPAYVYGTVKISNAAMTYIPRNLSFTNVAATLRFDKADLYLQNIKLQKGTTQLMMDGSLKNFLNLYYTDPEKIVLDWHIKSPMVNLDEFKTFLTKRKTTQTVTTKNSTNAKVTRISGQLDKLLDQSSVNMQVQVDKLVYKKFNASAINAEISLTQAGIGLNNMRIKHAGGSMVLNANIQQAGNINHVKLKTTVTDVNVKDFFYAFDNFGQQSITDANINGTLSTDVDVVASIRDNGTIVPNSFQGTAGFELKSGTLKNFEPLKKISKFIFRKRHLDDISFGTIKNKFDIKGDKIIIFPMRIESTVLNMDVEGVYAMGPGTNILIDVPLRNPKKDELIEDEEVKIDRQTKGIVLHLNAVDGDDGKVKIKWTRKRQDADSTAMPPDKQERKRKRNRK